MAQKTIFSRSILLRRIGLAPGKKSMVFFLSLIAVTLPLNHIYNSIAIILFVLFSMLAAHRRHFSFNLSLVLPVALFGLMALSLLWTGNVQVSLMALSKEAALLFIPVAFYLNRSLSRRSASDVLKYYSIAMCFFGAYLLLLACMRYYNTSNTLAFFHYELAAHYVTPVYLAAFFSLALFVFVSRPNKTFTGYLAIGFVLALLFLLSVKTVVITDLVLVGCYYLFFSGLPKKAIAIALVIFCLLFAGLAYYSNVYNSFKEEVSNKGNSLTKGMHNVTLFEAWNRPHFTPNDNLNAASFRLYQARIFKEMVQKDRIFFTGYGLNTSSPHIEATGRGHNLVHKNWQNQEYNRLNFHNQYIESFADLGVFGALLTLMLVGGCLINGLRAKYFNHIAFAVLMIALFLTESFLWRQKGVVFFSFFYCLFNDLLPQGTTKNNV